MKAVVYSKKEAYKSLFTSGTASVAVQKKSSFHKTLQQ